jgi:hypothetical protein
MYKEAQTNQKPGLAERKRCCSLLKDAKKVPCSKLCFFSPFVRVGLATIIDLARAARRPKSNLHVALFGNVAVIYQIFCQIFA